MILSSRALDAPRRDPLPKRGRLGQGAGHYDRAIANLRAIKPVFVLGLAYAGQEVDALPMEPHDQRLDAILTETGYIEVG